MKNINNMVSSIYNYPEQYAQDIVSSFELTPPIDVIKICKKLAINVNYEPLGNTEALLIVSQGKRNIVVNTNKVQYSSRVRFTIAHEIGHYIIPWHENSQQCDKTIDFNSTDIFECEANEFASELLVPKSILLEDIKGKRITLSLIKELADKYMVSLVVMARRILEFTESSAVVLIYYKDGTKFVQMKSKTFNEQIKAGRVTKSSAHKLLTSYNTSAEIKDILDSSIWFNTIDNNYTIVEESLFQSKLGRVFTLLRTVADEDISDLLWDF